MKLARSGIPCPKLQCPVATSVFPFGVCEQLGLHFIANSSSIMGNGFMITSGTSRYR